MADNDSFKNQKTFDAYQSFDLGMCHMSFKVTEAIFILLLAELNLTSLYTVASYLAVSFVSLFASVGYTNMPLCRSL